MPHTQHERHTLSAIAMSAALALAIVWGLALLLVQESHRATLHNAGAEVSQAVTNTATSLNRSLVGLDTLLAEVASWVEPPPVPPSRMATTPQSADAHSLNRLLRAALNQNLMLRDLAVVGNGGQVLASARADTRRLGLDAEPGFLARVRQQAYPALVIGTPVSTARIPELMVYLGRSKRLPDGSQVVVVAGVRVSLLTTELDPRDPSGATTVTLENTEGTLLATFPPGDRAGLHPGVPLLPEWPSDSGALQGLARLNAAPSLLAVRPLLYSGLWASASQPLTQALAPYEADRTRMVGAAAVLSLLVLGAAWGGRRHVLRLATARMQLAQANAHLHESNRALTTQAQELNQAKDELAATLEALPDLLFEVDETGLYLDARAHNTDKLALPVEQFLGRRVHEVMPGGTAAQVMQCLQEAKTTGSSYGRQVRLNMRGQTMWFELSAARKKTSPGEPARFVVVSRDITDRKADETLIWEQAHIDSLSGLPNRRMFLETLDKRVQAAAQGTATPPTKLALLFLDLDRFKEVNDTHGHDMGDLLLQQAAQRLKSCVRDTDLVARLGGDEFTLVVQGVDTEERVFRIADQLLARLAEPFYLGTEVEHISASVGITFYPQDGQSRDELITQADQAMYAAKRAGRNRWERFSPAMQEAALVRARIARDLRAALPGNQLRVVYQPIVNLKTGEVHKAEALLRWEHPLQGPIRPDLFIPIAEETGLINDIGRWVFDQATRQVLHWRNTLHPDFQMSINLSPVQFRDDSPGSAIWTDQLAQLGLPGNSVVLEITEGLLVDASTATRQRLNDLHAAGIGLALDDFGTGYSALSYLHEFELDHLKIDRSFVQHMETSPKDLALCKATVLMAHELGLNVVAEGVETEGQQALLREAGCDCGQGYLYSRPVSPVDFEHWLLQHQPPQPTRRTTSPLPDNTAP